MAKSAHAKRSSSPAFEKEAERTAENERAIQRKIDRSDKTKSSDKHESGAMQAGARVYPVPPLPDQHLRRPGLEADLALRFRRAPPSRSQAITMSWRGLIWPETLRQNE